MALEERSEGEEEGEGGREGGREGRERSVRFWKESDGCVGEGRKRRRRGRRRRRKRRRRQNGNGPEYGSTHSSLPPPLLFILLHNPIGRLCSQTASPSFPSPPPSVGMDRRVANQCCLPLPVCFEDEEGREERGEEAKDGGS